MSLKKGMKTLWLLPIGLLLLSILLIGACNKNNSSKTDEPSSSTNKNNPKPNEKPLTKKNYLKMSEDEKQKFINIKTDVILGKFGRTNGDKVSDKGLKSIKKFVDSYVKRINTKKINDCSQDTWGKSDLVSILERGRKNAPHIIESFNNERVEPKIGIYIAMIESEFCPCYQAPTGSLGMFQFTRSSGKEYGLKINREGSPTNPDDRCSPTKSAKAASSYVAFLYDYLKEKLGEEYGKNALGSPLAISAYNSGEGGLNKNVKTVQEINPNEIVNFWMLMENEDKLTKQFQVENVKYAPKFFAAMIIGENPSAFEIYDFQPLSETK